MWRANVLNLCANVCAKPKDGAPGAIPTRDLPLRRRTLYAAELREHEWEMVNGKWLMVKPQLSLEASAVCIEQQKAIARIPALSNL